MSAKARHAALAGARLRPVGVIRSVLKTRSKAPKQGSEGAPDAWLEVHPRVAKGLKGLEVGDEIVVITWFHRHVATSSKSTHGPTRAIRSRVSLRRDLRTDQTRWGFTPLFCARSTGTACASDRSKPSTEHRSSTSSQCCGEWKTRSAFPEKKVSARVRPSASSRRRSPVLDDR